MTAAGDGASARGIPRIELRRLGLAWRFALREMRGGLSGFRIFLACLTLGVAAIAAVNSVSIMMTEGIGHEGRSILGGDMRFGLVQREASADEFAYLADLGEVSTTASLRSMARLPDGRDQTLTEIKAVDGVYPLYGALETDRGAEPVPALLAEREGRFGALAAPEFFARLGLKPGDTVRLGSATFELRGTLLREPDVLSDGFLFAPRILLSLDGLGASALVQPGSLVAYNYKVRLRDPAADPKAIEAAANKRFPDAGWNVRTFDRAAPNLQQNIERFGHFLTLVGLTALVVGGIGVANAVRAYLDNKRGVIATFKSLGAGGSFVVSVYLIQILILATLGVALGLVLGALAPFAAARFLQTVIPISAEASIYPSALLLAAAFGYLTALAFALLPLGAARDVAATDLFRSAGVGNRGRVRPSYALATAGLVIAMAALTLLTAEDRRVAGIFIVATAIAFAVLRGVAVLVALAAAGMPRVRSTSLRMAIRNIHRPGALTSSVVLSLGLGLTLLVALSAINNALSREIGTELAARAPNFFFVDIQNEEIEPFRAAVARLAPGSTLEAAPMLRGRITQLNGVDVAKIEVPPEGAWVLKGDRGVTYADALPENTTLTAGAWWQAGYDGEPLVSFSAEEAGELGLTVGETVTVNVLGRNITARIANLRDVEWQSLSINFVMVFSPNAFRGAPHSWLATLDVPDGSADNERAILSGVTNAFPAVTSVRVKEALDAVNNLVAQLALAIRAAAAVALVASVLVLSGALAAGSRGRIHDAVVLKTLGATRGVLIRAFATEYMLLGLATAVFAIAAGGVAAWFVVRHVMDLPFVFGWTVALTTLAASLALTVGLGLVGTWRVLGQKAAPVLREL